MITLYSTGCPKCKVLKMKLDQKNIQYEVVNDIEYMKSLGIMSVPMLKVDDEILIFAKAVEWVNKQ